MKNIFRLILIFVCCIFLSEYSKADKCRWLKVKSTENIKSSAAGCLPGAGFKYLDINNVRCRINTGGDMFWDFEVAQYEIPSGSKKTSIFASALWIGGLDVNNQLKLSAQRFRQVGVDYWPGPLTIDGTAAVTDATCSKYDKHFPMTRAEVNEFLAWWNNKADYPDYAIPQSIKDWPGNGDPSANQSYYLAPFYDRDADGHYDPTQGDYPYYDVDNSLCPRNRENWYKPATRTHSILDPEPSIPVPDSYDSDGAWNQGGSEVDTMGILADQVIKGDQTLWWVFNDKGNIHTESKGAAIGLEIRAQAFAFSTNDEINNMTFYSYEIINRSTYTLTQTYFSQWLDPDLGYGADDYVGCDVNRGLGYCYNGRPKDGNGEYFAYGDQPPAVGVDFFQGPYMDPDYNSDGTPRDNPSYTGDCSILTSQYTSDQYAINGVNFGDSIPNNERFGMRRFVYYNNSGGYNGEPDKAMDYYNYLRGIWQNGAKMLYGGDALTTGLGPECDFMFPGDSDPCNWGTKGLLPNGAKNWTEETSGNQPGDRRFMQSAGPFTLLPGAVNYITVGIPWARAASGGAFASVELLRVTDDKCQALFDNCFKVISGPNAPDLTIRELDKELVVYISNRKIEDAGNNYNESYSEWDNTIKSPAGAHYDSLYNFEGYQVYQLANANVSVADIKDPDKARQVFQCDKKNNVSRLVNFNYDQALGAVVPELEVDGSNTGIVHSFKLSEDAFTGQSFVNHKQYYFLAVAYGYNNFMTYSADPAAQVENVSGLTGQKRVYLAGRGNIKVYTGIPHINVGETNPASSYEDGPQIIRLDGQGNGGLSLDLTKESIDEIMSKPPADSANNTFGNSNFPISYQPKYKNNKGPITIKVIDPLNVKDATYVLRFDSLYKEKINNVSGELGIFAGGDTATKYNSSWTLIDNSNGTEYHSDQSVIANNEQLFLDLGFSVVLTQAYYPGTYMVGYKSTGQTDSTKVFKALQENNGYLESSIQYADSTRKWLSGIYDSDEPIPNNWIRAGTSASSSNPTYDDWNLSYTTGSLANLVGQSYDPDGKYEKIINGTWAPYSLCNYGYTKINSGGIPTGTGQGVVSPAVTMNSKKIFNMSQLASVDIVITPDKSKWTRCPVVEMCPDALLSEDGAVKYFLRKGRSVDKNGNYAKAGAAASSNPEDPAYINATGMGWFPGYAINIETGERLNMMFGEDSWLSGENGRDMLWNPTSNAGTNSNPLFGGRHIVYVMSQGRIVDKITDRYFDAPAYDAGYALRRQLSLPPFPKPDNAVISPIDLAYASAMWVNIPMAVKGQEWLSNEVTIKIRVAKPYERYLAGAAGNTSIVMGPNRGFPMYQFSTSNIATVKNDVQKAKSDMDLINIVPNPYYGYCSYEVNQLDNRVKIVNLPKNCVVTIYNISGTLIRQYTKDDSRTYIDWDLKNHAGIPIAGGVYLIHVKSPGLGEKIIKWFGTLRPVDLNAF